MSLFIQWPFTIIIFVFFAFFVFYLMSRDRHLMLKIIYWLFGISSIGGFIIYSYCYLLSAKNASDIFVAAFRGLFDTIRMFFVDSDYEVLVTAVGEDFLTENTWLKVLFLVIHILAAIVLQAALLSLFGKKLIDYFRLRFSSYKYIYIIKGSDKSSLMLAENIAFHDKSLQYPDKNQLIIILLDEDNDEDEMYKKASQFDTIVQLLDAKHNLLYYIEKLNIQKNKNVNIILLQDCVSPSEIAFNASDFAVNKKVAPEKLNFFILTSSEWDREKIEELSSFYPYTFHIINEIDLSVRKMILKHPPFKCPRINFNNGITKQDFTVTIIGFGTVGQKALLRLIMNGQFTGSNMRAIVIDKNINKVKDVFMHRFPSINMSCDIEFIEIDILYKDFYNLLENTKEIDYIVVSLNSDDLNKQTALDIRLYYERKEMQLPFIAVSEKNGSAHAEKEEDKIFTFGCREEIYNESMIINEELDKTAKTINDTYTNLYGGKPWHKLDRFTQESNRASADFIPAMQYLTKDKNTEDQSILEVLAQTEHLRWNAFHFAMGYRPISIQEMKIRFKTYNGTKYSREHLDYSRRDAKLKLHACLVTWEDLDKVTNAYRELALLSGNEKEQKRDFKENDRDNIRLFL